MTTTTTPIIANQARMFSRTSMAQRYAYDALECLRIAVRRLDAISEWFETNDIEIYNAGAREPLGTEGWAKYSRSETASYIASDAWSWRNALKVCIKSLQEECHGPPTLTQKTFAMLRTVENRNQEMNLIPGIESVALALRFANRSLTQAAQNSANEEPEEWTSLDHSIRRAEFVAGKIACWLEGDCFIDDDEKYAA